MTVRRAAQPLPKVGSLALALRQRRDALGKLQGELDAILAYARALLDERPRTGPELRAALAERFPAEDAAALAYACRNLLACARLHLALAANYAGIGFGNAGVHIPHAVAYPIAGLVRDYVAPGYRTTHPLIPHGMSVILTAPAAFRFTYATAPERHLRAAELMGVPVRGLSEADRREALPQALLALMRDTGIPNGLSAVGYEERDVPALIDGTLKQPRLLAGAPRQVGAAELDWILRDALAYW